MLGIVDSNQSSSEIYNSWINPLVKSFVNKAHSVTHIKIAEKEFWEINKCSKASDQWAYALNLL